MRSSNSPRPPVPATDEEVARDCLEWLGDVLPLVTAFAGAEMSMAALGRTAGTVLGPASARPSRMLVLDATWANRGANRCFTTEGGVAPPPPRRMRDLTGDRLRRDLDRHEVAQLDHWLHLPAVAAGLGGLHAFSAGYVAAALDRR